MAAPVVPAGAGIKAGQERAVDALVEEGQVRGALCQQRLGGALDELLREVGQLRQRLRGVSTAAMVAREPDGRPPPQPW